MYLIFTQIQKEKKTQTIVTKENLKLEITQDENINKVHIMTEYGIVKQRKAERPINL
jgi:hypothetical protein